MSYYTDIRNSFSPKEKEANVIEIAKSGLHNQNQLAEIMELGSDTINTHIRVLDAKLKICRGKDEPNLKIVVIEE